MTVALVVDGVDVEVAGHGSLLEALRDELAITSAKDGCSPQGQCGCCTVLVDGAPRVACVTPVRRLVGREITTLGGLAPEVRDEWGAALCATGGSQCGFCTPGIVLRLEGLRRKPRGSRPNGAGRTEVDRALAAHLCRCTGWQTIREAYAAVEAGSVPALPGSVPALPGSVPALPGSVPALPGSGGRDGAAAATRARLEGRTPQRVEPAVALGEGGFADDTAPPDALVAVPDGDGGWAVAETLAEARRHAGKVQGRRTTLATEPPLDVPAGDWDLTLRTSWVEPAYLETDASWCLPGGEPVTALANGGAFGGKAASEVAGVARRLADEHGRAVRVLYTREDSVRRGPKRPPVAAGLRADGTGAFRVAATDGIVEQVALVAPGLAVEQVALAGPPTSAALRGAGWVEAAVLVAAAGGHSGNEPIEIVGPGGAWATAAVIADGVAGDGVAADAGTATVAATEHAQPRLSVTVCCGEVLDAVVLRSYCIGAAHMGLSWVTSESLTVDDHGEVLDLTVRSFGVLAAGAMPEVDVVIEPPGTPSPSGVVGPVAATNGSDAVFAAVAAAVWSHQGCPRDWPTGQAL